MNEDRGDGEGGWFQPYFSEWLVDKLFSGWTLLALCALTVAAIAWWLS